MAVVAQFSSGMYVQSPPELNLANHTTFMDSNRFKYAALKTSIIWVHVKSDFCQFAWVRVNTNHPESNNKTEIKQRHH